MDHESDHFAMHFEENDFRHSPLKVYLAGPLTNNDATADQQCEQIRAAVREEFLAFSGAFFEVYDPAEFTAPGSDHTAEEVYRTDHLRTIRADLVFFHVNEPSFGVGIEAQIAADATVPRVLAIPRNTKVSRMLQGVFAPTAAVISYDGVDDFRKQFRAHLPAVAAAAARCAQRRRAIFDRGRSIDFGRFLFKRRVVLQKSIDELACDTQIREFWLEELERHWEMWACASVAMLERLAEALDCELTLSTSVTLKAKEKLPEPQRQSLNNLADFALSKEPRVSDQKILSIWKDYAELASDGVVGREALDKPVSTAEWRERYHGLGLF